MANNEDIKKVAMDWAEGIIQDIITASHNPEFKLKDDSEREYQALKEWGWFDKNSLDTPKGEENTRLFLAIARYRHLKWHKEHPAKPKLSKWEVVAGKPRKK